MTRDLAALPKGHLHLHLEAAVRPQTYVELAQAAGVPALTIDVTSYDDFQDFVGCYQGLLPALTAPGHLERLLEETIAFQASQGVVYVELGVSPQFYAGAYGSVEAALEATCTIARTAGEAHGVAVGLMLTVDRCGTAEEALELARLAVAFADRGVVSLGLANDERDAPGAPFAEAFALAKAAGLWSTPHAGELEGPDYVREALDVLHADRVLHGVRSMEDPALVADLVARGVSLDVCPTSNLLLHVVQDLAAHPLPALLEAGVRCSINADDPVLFGPDVLAEYEVCREVLGLSDEQLAACAWTSIEHTPAPEHVKVAARAAIDAWLAA